MHERQVGRYLRRIPYAGLVCYIPGKLQRTQISKLYVFTYGRRTMAAQRCQTQQTGDSTSPVATSWRCPSRRATKKSGATYELVAQTHLTVFAGDESLHLRLVDFSCTGNSNAR